MDDSRPSLLAAFRSLSSGVSSSSQKCSSTPSPSARTPSFILDLPIPAQGHPHLIHPLCMMPAEPPTPVLDFSIHRARVAVIRAIELLRLTQGAGRGHGAVPNVRIVAHQVVGVPFAEPITIVLDGGRTVARVRGRFALPQSQTQAQRTCPCCLSACCPITNKRPNLCPVMSKTRPSCHKISLYTPDTILTLHVKRLSASPVTKGFQESDPTPPCTMLPDTARYWCRLRARRLCRH